MIAWSGVSRNQIDVFWPFVKPLLTPVIEKSPERYTEDGVLKELKAGNFQLWLTHEANAIEVALLTEIVTHVNVKYVRLQLVAGKNLRASSDMIYDVISRWAISHGCEFMSCFPRKGLARLLVRKYGFQFVRNTDEGKLYFKDLLSDAKLQ